MKPNLSRVVLPLFASLAVATPLIAQQGSVLVVLECQQPPARLFPEALKSIDVRRPTYPDGFQGNNSILARDEALFLALEQRLRDLLQQRAPHLTLLRSDAEGVLNDGDGSVARIDAQSNLTSSLRAEVVNTLDRQGITDRLTGGRHCRSISMTCVIGLFDQSRTSLADYAATLVLQDVAEAKMLGGGKNVSDFRDEAVVLKELIDRHAVRFVDRLIGFQGTKRFELTGASPACRHAGNLLRQGKVHEAMLRGVKAWQESDQADHQSAFIASVAYLKLGMRDQAESLCVQLRDKAKESYYDYGPYEDFLEFLKAGGTVVEAPVKKPGVANQPAKMQEAAASLGGSRGPVESAKRTQSFPACGATVALLSPQLLARLQQVARERLTRLGISQPTEAQLSEQVRTIVEDAVSIHLRGF